MQTFKDWIKNTSKNEKMLLVGQIILLAWLFLGTLGPSTLKTITQRNDNAIIKLIIGFWTIVYMPELWAIIKNNKHKLPTITIADIKKADPMLQYIDGLVVDDLVDFLHIEGGLPNDKFKQTFGKTNQEHKKLGDNLERMGILKRGPNNARILSNIDIDTILNILESDTDSDKIRLKTGNNTTFTVRELQHSII